MLDAILVQRNVQTKVKITVKTMVCLGLIVLAIVLPQIVHLALGASGGVLLLPMYLPVLIGGCLLGTWWGLGIGVLSPVLSFLLTSAFFQPNASAGEVAIHDGRACSFCSCFRAIF